MKKYLLLLILLVSFLCTVSSYAGGYTAIAFSRSTCRYGWAYGANSRHEAQQIALDGCATEDAQIVGWGYNGYLAFARGDGNSWGCAFGETRREAEIRALDACPSQNKHIEKWVYAFN